MPYNDLWSSIGLPIITSGIISGLVQLVLKARYDQRLEAFKGKLTAANARELERIRQDSTIAAERFKKSYGLLAERQADVVEKIYKHLAEVHLALLRLVSPGRFGGEPTDPELLQVLHDKRWKGMDYFRAKRLFLPADLAGEIERVYERFGSREMVFRYGIGGIERSERNWRKQGELWDEANGEIVTVLRDLEAKFRVLLEGGTI